MKLYYTNSLNYLGEQADSNKSLGGFVSMTPIQNDVLDNLFSEVSYYSLKNKLSETKCICLKNELGVDLINISFYINQTENSLFNFKCALVLPNINGKGEIYFEQINTSIAIPFYADFQVITGEENKVILEELNADDYIGIWLKREWKDDVIELTNYQDQCQLKISW